MKISRRSFVKYSTAFAGITILPNTVFGANERLNVAFVGVGGKGIHSLQCFTSTPDLINIVAFADVDESANSRKDAWAPAETYKKYPDVPRFQDFRVMLDKLDKEIDAVVITTPDHTHHYIAMKCMERGKHVYVEKPLAHNIAEVRDLMAAEKKYGLVCQMGNQGHSGMGMEMVRKWVDEGVLGDISEVRAWCAHPYGRGDVAPPAVEPVPEGFDWNLWLGPVADIGHSKAYYPGAWRNWNKFGGSALGDWACHNMDAPYEVLGLDCPSEVKIESTGPSKLAFPKSVKLTYTFPATEKRGPITMKWYEGSTFLPERPEGMDPRRQMGNDSGGTVMIGSKATIMTGTHADVPRVVPEAQHQEMAKAGALPRIQFSQSSHYDNWILACKGEEKCRSDFAYAGRLTETMMWGLIAMRVNRDLKIDPVKRTIIGDQEAAECMLAPQPRKGWEV